MTLLSLFEDYFIIVILRSTHCRYLKIILLSLFGFHFRENRNSYFVKTFLLCVRGFHYCYSMFIMRSIITLSLFEGHLIVVILRSTHCRYSKVILLSLFDFDFRGSSNSCFSHTFIMRPITSLLLLDDHLTYSTFDVKGGGV